MTNIELFKAMKPGHTETYEAYYRNNAGLEFNYSDIFSKLIKDAARTNRFQSDVYYILNELDETFKEYDPKNIPLPIWAGCRKDGVDGTGFVLAAESNKSMYGTMSQRYFALYSVSFRQEDSEYGMRYFVDFNEYWV